MPRVFVPAVLSGLLLWAAYFPLDLGFLGFFALVPWLTLVRADVSRRRRYLAAYAGGVVFSALATNWVRVAHPMMYFSWLAFTLVLPLFWVLALFLIRRLDRLGLPLALAVPLGWVAVEYMRMHFPTGYPFLKPLGLYHMIGFGWYFLGYTQHAFLPLIQVADVGGVYAVSFLVAAVNGAVAEWALRSAAVRRWLRWTEDPTPQPPPRSGEGALLSPPSLRGKGVGGLGLSTAAVALLFAGYLAYGFVRLQHPAFADGPRVAAIQGSVPQGEKMTDTAGLFKQYNRLCLSATREADLVVWPETCYPLNLYTVAPGTPPGAATDDAARAAAKSHEYLRFLAAGVVPPDSELRAEDFVPWRANVLLGMNTYEWDGNRDVPANTAILVGPDGSILGRYDKMHLVPFGEYVPLRTIFPWMKAFTPYTHDYSCRPGTDWTRFHFTARDGRPFTFGCLICYEDSDPYLARQYAAAEPVNFLVNISNDAWFDGTEEHEEHLAICRFRAVEARRSIVRAVNMGVSGVIDPDGRVVALPGPTWSKSKKMEGVVSAVVPIDARSPLYATLGDWLPAACWLAVLAALVAGRLRSRRL